MWKSIVTLEEDVSDQLTSSLNRYMNYVIGQEFLANAKIKILLYRVFDNWDSDSLIDKLEKKEDILGIIFFSLEKKPKGDYPHSTFNRSRMVREFFQNSFNSITVNHFDLLNELPRLICKAFNDKDLKKIFKDIKELRNTIYQAIMSRESTMKKFHGKQENNLLEAISENYPFGGIHCSRIGHDNLREIYERLEEKDKESIIADLETKDIKEIEMQMEMIGTLKRQDELIEKQKEVINKQGKVIKRQGDVIEKLAVIKESLQSQRNIERLYDWAWIVAGNPLQYKNFRILIIDDRPLRLSSNIKELTDYFPDDTEFYITGDDQWEEFFIENFWTSIYDMSAKLELYRIMRNSNSRYEHDSSRMIPEKTPLFNKDGFKFNYVVVDLLMENYNEGNQIINNLVNFRNVFNRMKSKSQEEKTFFDIIVLSLSEEAHDISRALNEGGLHYVPKKRIYMLPAVIAQLEKGREILEERDRYKERPQKARIFGKLYRLPEIIKRRLKTEPFLDLPGKDYFREKLKIEDDKLIQHLNDYLKIPAKEWIKNMPKADLHFHLGGSIPLEAIFFLSLNMLKDIPSQALNKIFKDTRDLILEILWGNWNNIFNLFKILESVLKQIANNLDSSIPSFQVVNIFNVLIGILEGKDEKEIEEFWNQLKKFKSLEFNLKNISKTDTLRKCILGLSNEEIDDISRDSISIFKVIRKTLQPPDEKNWDFKGILNHFVSAKLRKTASLDEYLAGNQLIGSNQLQKKENILAALYLIIKRNIEDNVRYLEIRLSPDGYTKSGELTIQEAINALLEYTDLITCYFYQQGKFIRVNYVLCVKRHKPPDQAAIEISAAITNREREKKFDKITPSVTRKNIEVLKYQWKPSKVVGVDLAGIEKNNPARRFVNDFFPAFKTSFFITVHAGEEDTAQSIWEAIYLLHANRIGHGLTLESNQYLIRLFRDLQICIEMNPISNLLTNPDKEEEYPFYEFVNEGIKVTINTDNQSVSESTLSEEYLKAAELYQKHRNNRKKSWISKWDMLRVIKNGFSGAFLDREEKRNLMRAVEEEIYQEIIEEYGC